MSNETKQTAVEWLYIEMGKFLYGKSEFRDANDILTKAKEMEKEQIAKAFDYGDYNYYCSIQTGNDLDDGQEHYQEFNDGQDYYNETYGGNK
jgi:hypothetical protein